MFMVRVRGMFQYEMDLDYVLLWWRGAKGRALLFPRSRICWSSGFRGSAGTVLWYRHGIATALAVRVWDRCNVTVLCAIPRL